MMIDCENFLVIELKLEDASSLNAMLLKNAQYFQRYFPVTLSENKTVEDPIKYINSKIECFQNKSEFVFRLKDKVIKQIVGLIIIKNIDYAIKEGEVAYCLDVDFGGKGYVTKGVEALVSFAFEKLGLNSLYILTHKTNTPSVRVAEKTGFKWSKTVVKGYTPPNEEPLDMEYYLLNKN